MHQKNRIRQAAFCLLRDVAQERLQTNSISDTLTREDLEKYPVMEKEKTYGKN
jgi:hypothetical protein